MRDDIDKLPLSKEAKAYARRKGLGAMRRQPRDFQKVNAQITNPGKPDRFVNYAAGETTDGRKIREAARKLVNTLLDA